MFAVVIGIMTVGPVMADDDDENGSVLAIVETEIEVDDGELEAEIETAGDIPTDGLSGLFGYGIITDPVGFDNTLALTTHAGAFDHTHQTPVPNPAKHVWSFLVVPKS